MRAEARGLLLVASAAILWSTGGVGIKAVEAGPLAVVFYRSLFGAIFLFTVARPPRPVVSWSFVAGIVSYAGCLTSFVIATKWTTAANAIFLQYSGVIWVMLASPLLLREPIRRDDVIAVLMAFSGMALFFAGRLEASGLAGNLVAIVSGAFLAGIFLSVRHAGDSAGLAVVSWGNVLAALAALPGTPPPQELSARSMLLLVLLGFFQIGLPYYLLVRGMAHVTATQASLTGMIEPVMNPIWVLLAIGEKPSGFAVLGGAVVLAAVGWHTTRRAGPKVATAT